MEEREVLRQALGEAQRALQGLEEEAARFGNLLIPAALKLELEDAQNEVISLVARLAQLSSPQRAPIPDSLPQRPFFVGRSGEVFQGLAALAPDAEGWGLVLDGAAGIGKTALAVEIAYRARQEARFDAYLFLAARTNVVTVDGVRADGLSPAALDAFVREFARRLSFEEILTIPDALERRGALLNALRGRRTLTLWDNLETLTDGERELIAEFLRQLPLPNKAILTSRQRAGEKALTLELGHLAGQDAFALIDALARPHSHLEVEIRHAGDSLRRLLYAVTEGNPLAIRWLFGLALQKDFSLADVGERLQELPRDPFTFLFCESGAGLDGKCRAVVVALTAFKTAADAQTLAAATDLSAGQVRACLETLSRLSWVEEMAPEQYSLHPLARSYTRSALGDGNALALADLGKLKMTPLAHRRALRYWVEYAQKYGEPASGRRQNYDQLDAAWPSLEAAASELYKQSDLPARMNNPEAARLLNDLADALAPFLGSRGYWDEHVRLSEWAYLAAQALHDDTQSGRRAYEMASLYLARSKTTLATPWAERCAEAWGRGSSLGNQADVVRLRGLIARRSGELSAAEDLLAEALAAYRKLGRETDQAGVLHDLGEVAHQRRRYSLADGYYRQALALAEKLEDVEMQAAYAGKLGLLALDRGRALESRPYFERALSQGRQIGSQALVARAKWGLANALEDEQRYRAALSLAQEALHVYESLRHEEAALVRQLVERLRQKVAS